MHYSYVSYTTDNKIIKGSLNASSEKAATETLVGLGYRVLSLKPLKPGVSIPQKYFPSFSRIKADSIAIFARQLATLIDAAVNIVTCLELLQAQASDQVLKNVLGKLVQDIREGSRLSDAMSKYPKIFPPIFWRSLAVGEQTGELGGTLNQVADYLEKGTSAKKGIKGALTYPIIILIMAIGVVVLLANFVLPTFMGLYSTLGAKLPAITRFFLGLVDAFRRYGLYGLLLLVLVGLSFAVYTRKPSGKWWWDGLKLKLPLVGRIIHLRELANCCQTVSVLFRCGLALGEVMDVVIDNSSNVVIRESLRQVKKAMLRGEGLSQPMSRNPIFLPMMVQMVKVGEESGSLDATLATVAKTYDMEADSKMKTFVAVIQPTVTVVIGVVVAFIVLAMVSAMYSIYGQM